MNDANEHDSARILFSDQRNSPFYLANRLIFYFLLCCSLAGCTRVSQKAPYPHESILTVIAELKIFLGQDPYRQAPGQDLNGRNIFRVSLERLDALQSLTDAARYGDVLAFARGECLERLGDWPQAQKAFAAAAQTSSSLARLAAQRAENAGKLAGLLGHHETNPTLDGYLNDLDVRERALREWLAAAPPWPYDAYLRQSLENLQEERARMLFMNRLVLDGAVAKALAAARKLVDEHPQSYRASDHWLFLGSFYETLARDWNGVNRPEGMTPRLDEGWSGWIEQARQAYRHVAQTDGDPAKLEGQARLRALDAYALRIQSLAR